MSIPLQKNPKNTKTLRQELRASATPAGEKDNKNQEYRVRHRVVFGIYNYLFVFL